MDIGNLGYEPDINEDNEDNDVTENEIYYRSRKNVNTRHLYTRS